MDQQKFLLLKKAAEKMVSEVPSSKFCVTQHVSFLETGRQLTKSEALAGKPPSDMLAASFEGWMPFLKMNELKPINADFVPDNLSKSGEPVLCFATYVERLFGLTSHWLAPDEVRAEWEIFFSPRMESDQSELIRRIFKYERDLNSQGPDKSPCHGTLA